MAYQSLGVGTNANDGSGDTLRAGGAKINDNFVEVYTKFGDASPAYKAVGYRKGQFLQKFVLKR